MKVYCLRITIGTVVKTFCYCEKCLLHFEINAIGGTLKYYLHEFLHGEVYLHMININIAVASVMYLKKSN